MRNGLNFLKERGFFSLLLVLLIYLIYQGYSVPWTGFGVQQAGAAAQPPKLLWDWLDLLIIPIVISLGAVLLTNMDRKKDTEIALDRLRETSFQAYLQGMSQLILDYHLGKQSDPGVRIVARARTIAVLKTLDADRKAIVVQFLFDAGLISGETPEISMVGANLQAVNLRRSILPGINLREAYLPGANFKFANLAHANFR